MASLGLQSWSHLLHVFFSPHHQARTCHLGTHRQLGYLFYLEAPKLCFKIILGFLRKTGWGKTSGMKCIHRPFTQAKREKEKKTTSNYAILNSARKSMNPRRWAGDGQGKQTNQAARERGGNWCVGGSGSLCSHIMGRQKLHLSNFEPFSKK